MYAEKMGLISFLIDGIFPRLCCHCGKIGSFLCPNCYNQLEFSDDLVTINDKFSIQSCTACGDVSSSIVHKLKYKSVKELASICAEIIYMSCSIAECDLITSVPLHPSRQRERGYNQAEEIAVKLAQLLGKPYIQLFERTKRTVNFARVTDKEERAKLSEGLFKLKNIDLKILENKSVLVIDDVWTTGSTLTACISQFPDSTSKTAITFTHGL